MTHNIGGRYDSQVQVPDPSHPSTFISWCVTVGTVLGLLIGIARELRSRHA